MAEARTHTISNAGGIAVAVSDRGMFDIVGRPRAWTFSGRVAGPVANVRSSRGRDRGGTFREIAFDFVGPGGAARRGAIRLYDRRNVVLFELTFVEPGNTDEAFPVLSNYPRPLHHLTYTGIFGGYSFSRFGADGPWVFFDDQRNTFILSAASHFMNSALQHGTHGQLRCGIAASTRRVPAGYVLSTVLAMASGINRAFDTWGQFLTDLAGKTRPANDADAGLKYLGYWTDHGARYYYRWARQSDYVATLLTVRDEFRRANLGLGYMQLDSWFYRKGRKGQWRSKDRLGGGTYLYEAAKELFPDDLGAFQKKLGLPLITHNRWIDERSPYRKKFAISGNVSVDPALWARWMRYLRAAGVRTYEQDWLSGPAVPQRDLTAGERFMDTMATAAQREGMTLQYCMPQPRHFLQGTRYDNLTTIRTGGDRFKRQHWKRFLMNARLATALGAWPWTDVFRSSETANLLIATLSGAMVGVGDAIGKLDRDSLMRAVRPDGLIVKPDTAVTPFDACYIAQAKDRSAPMIAAARTDHDGWVTSYVFAYGGRRVSVSPADLGYAGPVFAYDYFGKSGVYLAPDQPLRFSIPGEVAYWIVVPVAASGIGFLGDAGKFVANGKNRVRSIVNKGVLSARIVLAKDEDRVRLFGCARAKPTLRARGGEIENATYDRGSGLFQFDLVARAGASPQVAIATTPRRRSARLPPRN